MTYLPKNFNGILSELYTLLYSKLISVDYSQLIKVIYIIYISSFYGDVNFIIIQLISVTLEYYIIIIIIIFQLSTETNIMLIKTGKID